MEFCPNFGIMLLEKSVWMFAMLYFTPISLMDVTYGVLPQKKTWIKFQKKCVRIVSFSDFDSHANPLFIDLKILKFGMLLSCNSLNLRMSTAIALFLMTFVIYLIVPLKPIPPAGPQEAYKKTV